MCLCDFDEYYLYPCYIHREEYIIGCTTPLDYYQFVNDEEGIVFAS